MKKPKQKRDMTAFDNWMVKIKNIHYASLTNNNERDINIMKTIKS